LRPQHWTAPLSSAAHECPLALTEIAVAQPSSATNPTSAGSSSSPIGSVVPSPSWPNWLGPQHFTWPLSNSAQLWLATANSTTRVGVPTQPCSGSSSVVSLVSSVSPVSLVSSSPPIAVVPGPHASSHEARVEYRPVRSSRLTRPHGRMDPGQPRIGTNSPGLARTRHFHRQASSAVQSLP